MGLLDLFRSRESDFVKLLGEQAKKTCEGLEALEAYMKDGDDVQAKRVMTLEKEADELRRILIDELNRTFVTPIDREDLYALSRTIDDVIDYGYTTLDEMVTLGVKPNMYLAAHGFDFARSGGRIVPGRDSAQEPSASRARSCDARQSARKSRGECVPLGGR